jgi:hypothetical protein
MAAINIQLAKAIARLSGTNNWDVLDRFRSSYEEIHDQLWWYLADLGTEAVKKNSFLMHYLNSSLEEIVGSHIWLLQSLELPKIETVDWKAAQEQLARNSFREKIREFVVWEVTGVYSRIFLRCLNTNN